MKNIMKKMSAILVGMLLLGVLTACEPFDASGYVKAILDNTYYNDTTGIVEQGIGTDEEAVIIYEQEIEEQVGAILASLNASEELKAEYQKFYKDLYASAKYTVGEAVEVDNETFEVTVTYEKMHVFAEAVTAYATKITEMVEVWTEAALAGEEVPADDEMNELLFIALKDCLVSSLSNASFDEAATTTIRVQLIDKVWTPNQADLAALEYLLFDFDALYQE